MWGGGGGEVISPHPAGTRTSASEWDEGTSQGVLTAPTPAEEGDTKQGPSVRGDELIWTISPAQAPSGAPTAPHTHTLFGGIHTSFEIRFSGLP